MRFTADMQSSTSYLWMRGKKKVCNLFSEGES